MGSAAFGYFFALQVIVSLVAGCTMPNASYSSADEQIKEVQNYLSENAMITMGVAQLINIVILLPIWLKQRRYLPSVKQKAGTRVIVTGLVFALGSAFALAFLAELIAPVMQKIFPDGGYAAVTSGIVGGGSLVLQIAYTVIVGPIAEEIMFRGIVLNRLMSKIPVWAAVVISSLMFGLIHWNSVQSVMTFFSGMVFAILYVKTRSLGVCIIFHIINNGLSVLQEYIISNSGLGQETLGNVFFWVYIAVVAVAIIPSVIFFKSKGAAVLSAAILTSAVSGMTVLAAEETPLILGDANLDGSISLADAIEIQKYTVGIKNLGIKQEAAANVDNTEINIKSALLIQKYLLGYDTKLSIGQAIDEGKDGVIVSKTTNLYTSDLIEGVFEKNQQLFYSTKYNDIPFVEVNNGLKIFADCKMKMQ